MSTTTYGLDPDILAAAQTYGLSEAEVENPEHSYATGGLKRLFRLAQILELQKNQSQDDYIESRRPKWLLPECDSPKYARNFKLEHREQYAQYNALRTRAQQAKSRPVPPPWQVISGLTPDSEPLLSPDLRRTAITKLLRALESLARHELTLSNTNNQIRATRPFEGLHPSPAFLTSKTLLVPLSADSAACNPAAQSPQPPQAVPPTSPSAVPLRSVPLRPSAPSAVNIAPSTSPRTPYWDPLREICIYLQISRAKLSQYTLELTGITAGEIIDRLRAEPLESQLRQDLEKFIQTQSTRDPLELHKALKAFRKSPDFDRQTWAMSHGFANYRRLYKACILQYNLTPTQLEYQLLKELAAQPPEPQPPEPQPPIVQNPEKQSSTTPDIRNTNEKQDCATDVSAAVGALIRADREESEKSPQPV